MQTYRTVLIIGIIEVLIGSLTLLGNFLLILFDLNNKSPNVLLFVIVTASISTLIGVGILKFNRAAFYFLIYFSSVIILTKLLYFAGIVQFNGELEMAVHEAVNIPASEILRRTMNALKGLISIGYHTFVIIYLMRAKARSIFHR